MPPDDFVPDFDRSYVFMVFNHNHIRWADIRTGSASDAEALNWYGIIHTIPFFHFKRTGSYNFFAYPDAKATAYTSIGRRSRIDAVGPGQRGNVFGLGCHLQQILKSPGSSPVDRLTIGFYHHPVLHFQNTG
jgi:hypothetical protein